MIGPRRAFVDPVVAALGAGAAIALALRLSVSLFAASPLALALTPAVVALGVWAPRPPARLRTVAVGAAALCAWRAEDVARAVVWSAGYPALTPIALVLGVLVTANLAVGRGFSGRATGLASLAVAAGGLWVDRSLLCAIAAGAALIPLGGADRSPERPSPGRVAGATAVLVAGWAAWSLIRVPLDPTPLGFVALTTGAAVGRASSRGRWGAVAGLSLVGALAAALPRFDHAAVLAHAYGGDALLAGVGLAAGVLLGAVGPAAADLALASTLSAGLFPLLPLFLPVDVADAAATGDATLLAMADRAHAVRARSTRVEASVGPMGASVLRSVGTRLYEELDGSLEEAETRAGAAERFAGTLGACATDGRGRARVAGDDLGLAVEALRAQGFLAIDSAVADPAVPKALAAARPALARSWLHPSVRLVPLPGPAVLRAGPTADVVVDLVRSPWTDARRALPDRDGLRAARAGLTPTGAYVLELTTTSLDEDALYGFFAMFRSVFPHASLWLPPYGADAALLLGPASDAPVPWSGFERCAAADRDLTARTGLRTALDVAALALADDATLAGLPGGTPLGLGIPASARRPPTLPLTRLVDAKAASDRIFTSAPPELDERAPSRRLLLQLLGQAAEGDVQAAITDARSLADLPGGARAIEPLVRPHLDRARAAMERGQKEGSTSKAWEAAEAALATARTIAPRLAEVRCLEGRLAGLRGQLARAEDAYAACADLDPTSLDALEGLAGARRWRGNLTGAEEALRAARTAHPEKWTTALNLGVFLLQLGRLDEARGLLEEAIAAQSRAGGEESPAPHLALSRLHLADGRPEQALAEAQRALALARTADALAFRGAARVELHQLELAEQDFRDALAIDAGHVMARAGLGQVQAMHGEYDLAAASFKEVLARDPGNAAAEANLRLLAKQQAEP